MDYLKHPIIQQYLLWNEFGKTIGMSFTILEKGKVDYRLKIEEKHLATPQAAHGGVIAALMDAAVGVACLSAVCEEEKIASTVSLTINFLSPALLNDILIGSSEVIKKGKTVIFVQATIKNQEGKLIATALATLNAYPKNKLEQ